ncbi:MAG: hypothetical protein IJJ45_00350 [Clostridia bacterium]|nr:hypothetical protein [Clostridia bacterium]
MGKRVTDSKKARRKRKARRLMIRRRVAVAFAAGAVLLAVLAIASAPSLRLPIWLAASFAMIGHALLLARKKALSTAIYALTALLCLAIVVCGFLFKGYVFADGRYVPSSTLATTLRVTDSWPGDIRSMQQLQKLDMRDSTVTDFSPIASLGSLREVDLRGNAAFTRDDYDALTSALPGCEILWSNSAGDAGAEGGPAQVDLAQTDATPEELQALTEADPDGQIDDEVSLMGRRIAPDATAIDLRGAMDIDPDEIHSALARLSAVETVDLRGTPLPVETIAALAGADPDVRFQCSCDVPGGSMTTEDELPVVPAVGFEQLKAWMGFMDYMPNLKRMDARAVQLSEDQVAQLQADVHSRKLIYNFTAFGRPVSTLETELNLDGIQMTGVEEVERCINAMPDLARVSMLKCGLSYDQMAGLCDRHPEIKFVWWISFGKYKLRTDATAFTTGLYDNNKYNYTSATFAPLQYCTDLMMLDIGHCKMTGIEGLAKLKKLRVLILADNKISDLSPLQDLQDLEYVEIFLNKVSDFSPLANKEKLVDLNIYYNPVGDITPLCQIKSLKRLWIGKCGLSNGQIGKLRKALPDCKIVAKGSSSTGNGWRDHKHYRVIKAMYKQGKYIPFS